jgi:hypothetical protein
MVVRLSTYLRNKLLGVYTNKIISGDFETQAKVDEWTEVDCTATSEVGGGVGGSNHCLLTEVGGANPGKIHEDVTTKIGHLYMLELYFKKGTSDHGKFMIGTAGDEDLIYDSGNLTDADWIVKRHFFLATQTSHRVILQTNDAIGDRTSKFDSLRFVSLTHSIQDIFKDGFISIFDGTIPDTPDEGWNQKANCHILVTIYSDGAAAGLEFDDTVSGTTSSTISKKSTETWSGTAVLTGQATWFRLYAPGDTIASQSVLDERIDGDCASAGAALNMSSTSITATAVQSISTFQITQPYS